MPCVRLIGTYIYATEYKTFKGLYSTISVKNSLLHVRTNLMTILIFKGTWSYEDSDILQFYNVIFSHRKRNN